MKDLETIDVTVILTIWKRFNINEQLDSILSQNVIPREIWIYHCCDHVEVLSHKEVDFDIKYIYFSFDAGYFGRFSLGLLTKTKYVWIVDDDVIPSNSWLKKCLELCERQNAIVASSGRIIPAGNYRPELPENEKYLLKYFVGDGNQKSTNECQQDTIVDFGCNSWFIKKEWLNLFWSINPYTLETGEDIHLSASCRLSNIKTIVPKQQANGDCGNLKNVYGFDQYASWRDPKFLEIRENELRYWIDEIGWRPLLWN